ncbi:MAG: gliding motility-associated C-terminal domain-containing protein [Bacteroidetes bacterium]|nr:gliding motility-associated C-terminal domain-containing protein [Bacteroidota bacterium]MCL1968661.1 gliding motility-associated C-terminal domain-containing protein [Bacteroidota bacterium]
MYRLFLTSLFGLIVFPLVTNAQQLQPRLRSVSIDTVFPQQIKISWLDDKDIDSVAIYRCTQNCSIEDNYQRVAKLKISDLEWIDQNVTAPFPQIFYCIGWEWSGKSYPQNNMVLTSKSVSAGCPNSISLSWNSYINMLDTLDHYDVLHRKKNTPLLPFNKLASTKNNYYTALLDNETVYDFVIQAVSKNDTIYAFSNIVTDSTEKASIDPVEVSITRVSVINDQYIEVDVKTDDVPDPDNMINLYLYRDRIDNNVVKLSVIDSLPHNSKNEYFFTDKDVNPYLGLYYYYAIVGHKCKPKDYSDTITNIFLTGDRVKDEKYKDQITFTQTGTSSVDTYDLLVNKVEYPTSYPLTISQNSYIADVEKFMNEGSNIEYQIRLEKLEKDWYSNTVIIPHEPVVDFPNAFYPSDNARVEDRTFYPILYFPSEDNYLFVIYNRWGQELYRSTLPPVNNEYTDMQGRWDGKFKGEDCPAGIYAYKLSYKYNNGKGKFSTSGSFMLVR